MKKIFSLLAVAFCAVTIFAGTTKIDVKYCTAFYYESDGEYAWQFNLYKDYDEVTEKTTYPDLYITIAAESKTKINGTYEPVQVLLFTSARDSVEAYDNEKFFIQRVGENYSFKLKFEDEEQNKYILDVVVPVYAIDDDTKKEIVLTDPEGGAQAINNVSERAKAIKVMRQGQVLIIRDGVKYNATGAVVE